MAVEDIAEAVDSAHGQTGGQTWGRPDRSECESIEMMRSVLYRGGGAALRTNCVSDVGVQGTTRLL